jgi:hypothetical protein
MRVMSILPPQIESPAANRKVSPFDAVLGALLAEYQHACPPWSAFDRPSAGIGDPDANDFDRLAASLDYLTLCSCETPTLPVTLGADETDKHLPLEAVTEDKQFPRLRHVDCRRAALALGGAQG